MGRKKNFAVRSKPLGSPAVADGRAASYVSLESVTVVDSEVIDSASYASIKLECERALNSLRIGNHTKALRAMKDLCLKHENSPYVSLIHRVHGTVCLKVASIIDDLNAKKRHLKNAMEFAKKATVMSPNSIEFSHFYANLLYEAANENNEYDEVVQECERALAIESPVDPGMESLQESQLKLPTPEARIRNVQNDIRNLIQKSNIASISTWMKHLGTGDEKFRLIPIRRVPEDPMELSSVQARRPNEIKKATKTLEERRKDIEVRVAAARLLMHKSESIQSAIDGDKGLDSPVRLAQKGGERRKSGPARKNASSTETRGWVQSYWNSMTTDMKKELLKIRILDLKIHFSSLKDGLASQVLSEALQFSEANKSWKFWECCNCGEKFTDPELHILHVTHEHVMGNLAPKLRSVLPQNVGNKWAKALLNCPWKPLDITAATKMLEIKSKPQDCAHLHYTHQRNDLDQSIEEFSKTNCHDECGLLPRKKHLGDRHNNTTIERSECENISDIEWTDFDGNGGTGIGSLPDGWPISDDTERAKILERIHTAFQSLIKNKCLASSHLNKVMNFAVEELKGLDSGSQLINCNIDRTPLCICFLGSQELTKVLKFLQELSQTCGPSRYSEINNGIEDSNDGTTGVDAMQKIVFSEDGSYLLFDEHFLSHNHFPSRLHNAVTDDKIAAVSSNIPNDDGGLFDSDALFSWIFVGQTSGEQLEYWSQSREEKARQGTEILSLLENEYRELQGLCERKCEHLSYKDAVKVVEDLCLEESNKREHATDFVCQSYDVVLKKRREELLENHHGVANIGHRIEVEAISNVLNDAESLNARQFIYGETYSDMTAHLCALELGEDENWRVKEFLHQADSCVEVAIQRQKEHKSIELSKIDARILCVLSGVRHLELKLEPISGNDYRRVLVPLVKSFLRAYLEGLADKDATERSDAAREAFLAELALDSMKSSGGSDIPKHVTEKTKDKKKNKDHRKCKDAKASSGNMLPIHHHETYERTSFQVANDGANQVGELVIAGSNDSPSQDYKLRIVLEEEERKLEETLEYQRQIENEAKLLLHLSAEHKKVETTLSEKMPAEVMPDAYSGYKEYQDASEQRKNNKDSMLPTDDSPEILEGVITITADVDAKRTEVQNGGMPEDDTAISDQTGKKSRRQKGLKKSYEGKYPAVTSGGEKNMVGALISSDNLQGTLPKAHPEMGYSGVSPNARATETGRVHVYGAGLRNEIGEYNCFLNVIIQSLWNLSRFRDEFMRSSSDHVHVGDPCVTCALYGIFTALSMASLETQREAVAPTSLRIALSNLYPDSNFFQEGQMNDASEVLGVIFDCLHQSFTSDLGTSDTKSTARCLDSWDCANSACIVHSLFGMDIFERMLCPNCKLESRHLKYTTFFHNINANALRTMKGMHRESSFDDLMNLVEGNHQLACDPDAGGCGKLNCINHFLSSPPHVFTIVLGWRNTCESLDDIRATLAALCTEIDISVPYHGLEPNSKYSLVSVVCYYRQHYHCVAYSPHHEKWIMYDDKTVKVIGSWDDVLTMCIKGHLQPQVFFFEAAAN